MSQSARITLLLLLFSVVVVIAITSGKYSLTVNELWTVVSSKLTEHIEESRTATVFWQIRLPRVLAAILIGGGLAIAGAAYQGMFRNPLVSP
ncbi:iron chelate uptake ABC transporter family permease subunit, partial [Proteus mirabilis]